MHTRLLLALTAGAWLIMADATLADEVGATKTQAETVQTAIGDDTQESTGDPAIDPRPVPQVRKDSGVEFRRNDHSINGPGGRGPRGSSGGGTSDSSDGGGGGGGAID